MPVGIMGSGQDRQGQALGRLAVGLADTALQLGTRVAGRLINPGGAPRERALHDAVAGRVVLVTGASYGIGEATARRLAAAGATVLLAARSADRLADLVAEIEAAGGRAHAYPLDLADPDNVDEFVDRILDEHGQVDVLVNNAGKSIRRSLELSYDRFHDYRRTIDVNYLGPVRLLLGLLPAMRARGQGQVINISTIGARVPPSPRWGAYQASKSAYDVFLRSAATEIAGDGVAVTSIYMALIHTRMSAPTPIYRHMPGLTPDEAAGLVARAIVDRPRTITPWWAQAVEIGAAFTRVPWEVANSLAYRATGDTKAARARAAEVEEDPAPSPERASSTQGNGRAR
jgi:NAD(P)-dependent dehydrogenase (short-subunit alcohol dehydrogenase family)